MILFNKNYACGRREQGLRAPRRVICARRYMARATIVAHRWGGSTPSLFERIRERAPPHGGSAALWPAITELRPAHPTALSAIAEA
jgi:hypothetical protein